MGACATKPKVAKDGDIAPVLPLEPEKEAVSVSAEVSASVKENTVDLHDNKVNEIVDHDDDDGDDDQTAKRPSLSHFFKENEQAKELAESEATTNTEKPESTEIEKPENPIVEERPVTLIPMEEVKQSEPVEAAVIVEQLETETPEEPLKENQSAAEKAIEPEKQEQKPVQITETHEEKPVEIPEKQKSIATDEKFSDAQTTILTEKSLEPEEIKQVTIVTGTSLEPSEKQESAASEKSLEPEEIKQVTIVTETSLEPSEKQESAASEKSVEITELEISEPIPNPAAVDAAPVIEKVIIETTPAIEIKSSQAEKEEKAEEAK